MKVRQVVIDEDQRIHLDFANENQVGVKSTKLIDNKRWLALGTIAFLVILIVIIIVATSSGGSSNVAVAPI